MIRQVSFFILFVAIVLSANTAVAGGAKKYVKEFYNNGQLKAEGWQQMTVKTDYWIFYHPNGSIASKGHFKDNKRHGYWYFYHSEGALEKEGHFILNSAEDWWIFYEIGSSNKSKFQFKNNQKDGICLRYKNKKLVKAERYHKDQKMGEWTSVRSFRRDNPDVQLR